MQYGLIGEKLGHSYSVEIHGMISDEPYELREIPREKLEGFLRERDFRGINVTIPYKQAVMPYLDEISETARAIGAVNTVVNRGGRLKGYNTDCDGLTRLIRRVCPDIRGKKVLIAGTGGTSRTAAYAAGQLGAAQVIRMSRSGKEGAVRYEDAAREHGDAEIIINTTPCGMFPDNGGKPLELEAFPKVQAVIDAVYNPLRTRLVLEAMDKGIPAEGGLFMLAAQAVRAAELFRDTQFPPETAERVWDAVRRMKENTVLIGMPGSGKSAVAAALGRMTGRPVVDTDAKIVQAVGMEITEIFRTLGEAAFREMETKVIRECGRKAGIIISTGGGAPMRRENVDALRQNGRIVLLERELSELMPTDDRPLGNTREKMEALYRERMPVYRAAADCAVPVEGTAEDVAGIIWGLSSAWDLFPKSEDLDRSSSDRPQTPSERI